MTYIVCVHPSPHTMSSPCMRLSIRFFFWRFWNPNAFWDFPWEVLQEKVFVGPENIDICIFGIRPFCGGGQFENRHIFLSEPIALHAGVAICG